MSLSAYPSYMSGSDDWLGKMPSHWAVVPLKAIFKIVGGSTPSSDTEDFWGGEVKWITPADLSRLGSLYITETERKLTEKGVNSCGTSIVPKNSIVLSTRAPIGSLAVTMAPMCTNQGCKSLVNLGAEEPAFFAYVLGACTDELNIRGKGTTFLELSGDQLGAFRVPRPPYEEQVSIKHFLDAELRRLDMLVAEQDRLLSLLAEKRQATISHAVTQGLNPDAPMKNSGVEWLGEVPAHWSLKRIKYLVIKDDGIQMGPFGGMLLDLDSEESGFKVYGQENTISGDFTLGRRWISEERYKALERYSLHSGDLVLTRKGSLGNCRLIETLPEPGIADSDTIRLRVCNDSISPSFLKILLHDAAYVFVQIAQSRRGAILAGLNTETIANVLIVVPPRSEQDHLMKVLASQLAEIDKLVTEAIFATDLLKERRTALISAAVTGKIDVRNYKNTDAA